VRVFHFLEPNLTPILSNVAPSSFDARDYKYSGVTAKLPASVDLMPFTTEVEDQQSQGSCTANATTSAVELMAKRAGIDEDLSRQFNYYLSREEENRLGQDGATLRGAVNAGYKTGFCLESEWPYDANEANVHPAEACYASAATRKITRYEAIELSTIHNGVTFWQVVDNLKSALAEGLPVIVAMKAYETIYSIKGPLKDQIYRIWDAAKGWYYPEIGNHAVTLIGYDDELHGFIFANSWGKEWGDGGFGLLDYNVTSVIFEAWVVRGYRDIEIVKPEPLPVPAPTPIPEPAPQPQPIPEPPQPIPEPEHEPEHKLDVLPIVLLGAALAFVAGKVAGLW
jgi:C1A family cysteine protease